MKQPQYLDLMKLGEFGVSDTYQAGAAVPCNYYVWHAEWNAAKKKSRALLDGVSHLLSRLYPWFQDLSPLIPAYTWALKPY